MIGKIISHYKILEKLGAGGMGEVYLAEDTKLDRKVAMKFLPPHASLDADANARFQREAKAAAALNHPNIITVHEIGEHEGRAFIAMEYIKGQSLREKIKTAIVPLLIDEVINIASQVCEGLAAAHQAGITHRDLKPENLMIAADGRVKILDFGLAKLRGVSKLTAEATTLGTISYMSPEQARGEEVDHRTDIWSLGVVLYEMIAGQLPFKGEYEAALFYSIMNEQPEPLARYKAGVSDALQRIVDKTLDKDRGTRYQHVDDLLADLKRERKSTAELIKPVTVRRKLFQQRKPKPVAFVLAFAALLIVSLYMFNRQPAKHGVPTHKQLTFVGDASFPAISPDGQFIAYVTRQHIAGQKVMVQDLVGGQPLEVYQADRCEYPRWSPDGTEFVFSANWQVTLLPRLGGNARNIGNIDFQIITCWSPNGSQVAGSYFHSFMTIASKSAGEQAYLHFSKSFSPVLSLDWSPLSNRLAFLTQAPKGYTIWTINIDGSEQQQVLEDSLALFSPRWSADGSVVYYLRSDGQTQDLMKVRISPESGKSQSSPATLLAGLPFGGYFTLTRDNKRLLYTRETTSQNLWLVTLKGEGKNRTFETRPLTIGTLWAHDPAISPDGKSVVFSIGKRPRANLFVMPLAGGPMQQLTYLNSYNFGPAWSPDGDEIAFGSTQDGIPRVWKVNSKGGTPRPFLKSELSTDLSRLTWHPGTDILYQRDLNQNYHFLNSTTEAERPLVEKQPEGTGWIFRPCYSPNAKNVVVYCNRWDKAGKSTQGIWLVSLKDHSQVLLYRGHVHPIKWSAGGRWIYACDAAKKPLKILKIPIDGGQPQDMVVLPYEGYDSETIIDMSPDEKQLVYPDKEEQSDVWLVENFDPENELDKPVAVPDFPEMRQLAYLQQGTNLYNQKKYSEAEAVLRKGLELNAKHVTLLLALGETLYEQRKYPEAEETFRRGLEINPEHRALLDGIRWAAFYNKNLAAARTYHERYLEVAPARSEKISALVDLGAIGILQRDYAAAENNLRKALTLDSTSVEAHLQRGYLFAEQARYDEAKTFAEKALDTSFAGYNLMAYVLVAGELDIDRGMACAEKALNFKPEDWPQTSPAYSYNAIFETTHSRAATYSYYAIPQHTLGLARLKKGEYQKAVQYLEQAAALAPEKQAIQDDLQLARRKLQEVTNK